MTHNLLLLKVTLISIVILIALITDIRTRKIYNILTIPAIIAGIVLSTVVPLFSQDGLYSFLAELGSSVAGLLLALVVFFVFFAFGWFGGGDAKLMGAIGAFMGLRFTVWCILFTLVAGGLLSMLLIVTSVLKKQHNSQIISFFISLKDKMLYNTPLLLPDKSRSTTFTYSIAIALGFAATLVKFGYLPVSLP